VLIAGELFPGPHLYGGMTITILWAGKPSHIIAMHNGDTTMRIYVLLFIVAASMVPAMQKGNDAARIAHIATNTANLVLFTYQIITGLTELSYLFEG